MMVFTVQTHTCSFVKGLKTEGLLSAPNTLTFRTLKHLRGIHKPGQDGSEVTHSPSSAPFSLGLLLQEPRRQKTSLSWHGEQWDELKLPLHIYSSSN